MKMFNKIFNELVDNIKTCKNSLSKLPNTSSSDYDYIVFDLETSGLSIQQCEILEIGAIAIKEGKIVNTFSSLCKPTKPVPHSALQINHLNIKDLNVAPNIKNVLSQFISFIGNNILVGYNCDKFDIPIFKRYIKDLKIKYNVPESIDVYSIAKDKLPDMQNYRLTSVADRLHVDYDIAHRAIDDSIITYKCYEILKEMSDIFIDKRGFYGNKLSQETLSLRALDEILRKILSDGVIEECEIIELNTWITQHANLSGTYPYDIICDALRKVLNTKNIESLDIICNKILSGNMCDPFCDINLNGNGCAVTGEFENFSRDYIENIITKNGGILKKAVSRNVQYLIVGSYGSDAWSMSSYGTKIKKAKELQLKGHTIKIISEDNFIQFYK